MAPPRARVDGAEPLVDVSPQTFWGGLAMDQGVPGDRPASADHFASLV